MLLFAGKSDKDIIIVQRPIAQSDGLSHPKSISANLQSFDNMDFFVKKSRRNGKIVLKYN